MMPFTTFAKTPGAFKPAAETNGDSKHSPKLTKTSKDQLNQPAPLTYDLSAVIVHKGDISSGHYINYAREGRNWFLFDDSKVVLVDEAEVLRAEAYLLLYCVAEYAENQDEDSSGDEAD
jgi:ubiquitin carboxyl-terminal hydrolase 22/27/51